MALAVIPLRLQRCVVTQRCTVSLVNRQRALVQRALERRELAAHDDVVLALEQVAERGLVAPQHEPVDLLLEPVHALEPERFGLVARRLLVPALDRVLVEALEVLVLGPERGAARDEREEREEERGVTLEAMKDLKALEAAIRLLCENFSIEV